MQMKLVAFAIGTLLVSYFSDSIYKQIASELCVLCAALFNTRSGAVTILRVVGKSPSAAVSLRQMVDHCDSQYGRPRAAIYPISTSYCRFFYNDNLFL
jgi:hypothetical protein